MVVGGREIKLIAEGLHYEHLYYRSRVSEVIDCVLERMIVPRNNNVL